MKKIKVCLIPSICLNVSEFQGLITVCVIAQETSGRFISDHVFWLSVRTSCVCERDISRRSWGSFFKLSDNHQFDSGLKWWWIWRSKGKLCPHKAVNSQNTSFGLLKVILQNLIQRNSSTFDENSKMWTDRYQRSKVTVSSSESWLVEVKNWSTVFLVQSEINLCTLNKVEINSTCSQLSVYMMLSLF